MTEINLLPWREMRASDNRKCLLLHGFFGISLGIVLILCIHYFLNRSLTEQFSRDQSLATEIAILDKQIAEKIKIKQRVDQLLLRAKTIQDQQRKRQVLLQVLEGLAALLPKGVSLHALRWQEGQLVLEGEALSNARLSLFIHQLEAGSLVKHPLITGMQKGGTGSFPAVNLFKLRLALKTAEQRILVSKQGGGEP